MHILGTIVVRPVLPERIAGLQEISRNLWWSWTPEALALFSGLDKDLWETVGHNPVAVLANIDQAKLEAAAADSAYTKSYDKMYKEFKEYINPKTTRFATSFPKSTDKCIAYFSAEFGMHESLPIYSGGLGILSGDHLKTASDLGIPMVGVGLIYNHGYFIQSINQDGWQEASYKPLDFSTVPADKAVDENGREIIVQIEMPDRIVSARVWKIQVGRIPLYLLDTDIESNSMADRSLSARLYGGDNEMRIAQEKILGIGGVKALRRVGIKPDVWHMNEGHSAFLSIELMREYVASGLNWREAFEAVSPKVCFTTHTPVPAGQDAFSSDLMERHFWNVRNQLGMSRREFMAMGQNPNRPDENFNLTVFSLKMARYRNGVSALHGSVSRHLWRDVWPEAPVAEIPITSVTNGVHLGTWVAPQIAALYDKYITKAWRNNPDDPELWKKHSIPAAAMWSVHQELKNRMIEGVRARHERRLRRLGASFSAIEEAKKMLNPNVLTIGFARRFATYKRAVLLFSDIERLKRIMFAPGREVNFVFAGKAHPADRPGQEFIKRIHDLSNMPEFKGHVILLEDYDIDLAKYLVQGVDVWLNNPRRPLEASGTSGEKAAMNGVLNFSVMDGWWAEGCIDGENGWAIGENRPYNSNEEQDFIDTNSLYSTLEERIVPAYYDNRNAEGMPEKWAEMMLCTVRTLVPAYSTHRMLHDYCHDIYIPAEVDGERANANGCAQAKALAAWKQSLEYTWNEVSLETEFEHQAEVKRGQEVSLRVRAFLGRLRPEDVKVELYAGSLVNNEIVNPMVAVLNYRGYSDGAHHYEGRVTPNATGTFAYAVRAVPTHPAATFNEAINFIRWSR